MQRHLAIVAASVLTLSGPSLAESLTWTSIAGTVRASGPDGSTFLDELNPSATAQQISADLSNIASAEVRVDQQGARADWSAVAPDGSSEVDLQLAFTPHAAGSL